MGENQNQPFQLSFNTSLRVDFQGSRVTSDGGLLLVRELDERLGLSALIAKNMMDDRRGKNTQLPHGQFTSALPGWFMDVDGEILVLPGGALRFLRAIAAALAGCNVGLVQLPLPKLFLRSRNLCRLDKRFSHGGVETALQSERTTCSTGRTNPEAGAGDGAADLR